MCMTLLLGMIHEKLFYVPIYSHQLLPIFMNFACKFCCCHRHFKSILSVLTNFILTGANLQSCSEKNLFWKHSGNPQEPSHRGVQFWLNLQVYKIAHHHQCFPGTFWKFSEQFVGHLWRTGPVWSKWDRN